MTLSKTKDNPIKTWYDKNSIDRFIVEDRDRVKYERGMLISMSNHGCSYGKLFKEFDDLYISFLKAVKGKECKISKWNITLLQGEWRGNRINLPSRNKLLDLCNDNIPIMLCGVHNYKLNDPRSYGKESTHAHFYIYNIHKHLPNNPIELKNIESKIESNLYRYGKTKTRKLGIVKVTEVGIGKYKYTDDVTPLKLYDYLNSPNSNPQSHNVINYISNNKHMTSIQYPLTTIYHNKRL